MISTEIITAIGAGGRITTDQGTRYCQGNALHRVGGSVTVIGNTVMGWRRKTGAPPPVAVGKMYRFADSVALKMYYVDTEFTAVVREEDIAPPVTDAVLLLHCYNEDTEYMVWFIESRCVIQQDGETVADFTSVFPAAPNESDAYIDEDGVLVWGASVKNMDDYPARPTTMAVYATGELTKSKTYNDTDTEQTYTDRILARLQAVDYTVDVTQFDPVVTTSPILTISAVTGVSYEAQYDGAVLECSPSASIASGILFDSLHADALIPIYSHGSATIKMHVTATDASGDVSYSTDVLRADLLNTVIFKASDGSVVAESQAQDGSTEATVDPATYSATTYDEYADGFTPAVGTVLEDSTAPTATRFYLVFGSDINERLLTDGGAGLGYDNFTVTCTSGANLGDSRVGRAGTRAVDNGTVYVQLRFNVGWTNVPAVGDTYSFGVRTGTRTKTETECSAYITASFPAVNTDTEPAVTTDIGNNYAVKNAPKIGSASGYVYPVSSIELDGTKIYDGPDHSALAGAWRTDSGEMAGVTGTKIITAESATATDTENAILQSIVTKRFA